MPIMELKNICKIYGSGESRVAALNGVSLTVGQGEFTAVAGASGSGKSTLMSLMGCLDTQTSGEYLFCGENVGKLSEKRLTEIRSKEIGFIFQSFDLIPGLTALENVELPLIYRYAQKYPQGNCGLRSGKSFSRKQALPLPFGYVGRTAAESCHRPSRCRRPVGDTCR